MWVALFGRPYIFAIIMFGSAELCTSSAAGSIVKICRQMELAEVSFFELESESDTTWISKTRHLYENLQEYFFVK